LAQVAVALHADDVLDLGCGTGDLLIEIARRKKKRKVEGLGR
jgi:ubiquinone/menaquinone biosynthesis C-methylase UbiE